MIVPLKNCREHKLLWLLVCSVLVGCQAKPESTTSVSGSVTVAKNLLEEGLITFVPIAETPGPKISVSIDHGKYNITAKNGIMPGRYRVEVFGLPPGIKAMSAGEPITHVKTNYKEIAPQFNSASTLFCTLPEGESIKDFEVAYGR